MQTSSRSGSRSEVRSELTAALIRCRSAFIGVGIMTGLINVLYLTGSFFMLEVYDRVIPSGSMATLLGLAVLATLLYAFQGALDILRARVLVRIVAFIDEAVSARVYECVARLPLKMRGSADTLQPLRDLDQVRAFLSGLGPPALFDLPWMPLYLGICFLFHPWIGLTALAGALVLVGLTLLTERLGRAPSKAAASFASARYAQADATRRNAEVVQAMGMGSRLARRWSEINANYMAAQQKASDVAGGLGAISKVVRMMLQSAVLGVGAYLVIRHEATAGIIIAGSILSSRALAPVELAIANWKGLLSARQSWHRLNELLRLFPTMDAPLSLPKPRTNLSVEGVAAVPPGSQTAVVHEVTFRLSAGSALGIVGPSGSGKSSLARVLVGVWTPARGKVRLDEAAFEQWSPDALGQHIGYLPQDIELFDGNVAENIARFEKDADPRKVLGAAKAAGAHELILRLPQGYATQIGEGGATLSAGQRQRVALARALYGDPFLVVLDEPNSNLDGEGEEALTQAIANVRRRGGIAIVIAHRASALAAVDQVLVLTQGQMQALGPKDEVLAKLWRRSPPTAPQTPVRALPEAKEATV